MASSCDTDAGSDGDEERSTRRKVLEWGAAAAGAVGILGVSTLLPKSEPPINIEKWDDARPAPGVEKFAGVKSGKFWFDTGFNRWMLRLTVSGSHAYDYLGYVQGDGSAGVNGQANVFPAPDGERITADLPAIRDSLLVTAVNDAEEPTRVWAMAVSFPFDPAVVRGQDLLSREEDPETTVSEFQVRRTEVSE